MFARATKSKIANHWFWEKIETKYFLPVIYERYRESTLEVTTWFESPSHVDHFLRNGWLRTSLLRELWCPNISHILEWTLENYGISKLLKSLQIGLKLMHGHIVISIRRKLSSLNFVVHRFLVVRMRTHEFIFLVLACQKSRSKTLAKTIVENHYTNNFY